MEKQVRLFTPNWSHTVPISSSLFSSLIQPYKTSGEEIPDEIELPPSTAMVIEEEWPHYLALEAFMNEPTEPSEEGGIMTDSASDMPVGLMRVANGSGAFGNHSTPIYLHSILRLSKILNFPQGWEEYVAVNERSSDSTRHIINQGKAMMRNRPNLSFLEYIGEHEMNEDNFTIPYIAEMAKESIKGSKNEKLAIEAVFYGVMRNAMLLAYFERKEGIDWTDVAWGDIPLLLTMQTGKYGRRGPMLATAAVLGGNYEVEKHLPATYPIRTPVITPEGLLLYHLVPGSHGDTIPQVSLLYDRLLKSFPGSVESGSLGVPPSLFTGRELYTIDQIQEKLIKSDNLDSILDFVTWVNWATILFYLSSRYRTGDTLHPTGRDFPKLPTEEDYPRIVELMAITTVGRNGLVAILISLLHQIKKKHDDKMDRFASEIEKYLEEHPNDEDYPRFTLDMYNKRVEDVVLRDL